MNTKTQIDKALRGSVKGKLSITKIASYKDMYQEYQVKYNNNVVGTYMLINTNDFMLSDDILEGLVSGVKGSCEMMTSNLMDAIDRVL